MAQGGDGDKIPWRWLGIECWREENFNSHRYNEDSYRCEYWKKKENWSKCDLKF